jgi:hypothetical protein
VTPKKTLPRLALLGLLAGGCIDAESAIMPPDPEGSAKLDLSRPIAGTLSGAEQDLFRFEAAGLRGVLALAGDDRTEVSTRLDGATALPLVIVPPVGRDTWFAADGAALDPAGAAALVQGELAEPPVTFCQARVLQRNGVRVEIDGRVYLAGVGLDRTMPKGVHTLALAAAAGCPWDYHDKACDGHDCTQWFTGYKGGCRAPFDPVGVAFGWCGCNKNPP